MAAASALFAESSCASSSATRLSYFLRARVDSPFRRDSMSVIEMVSSSIVRCVVFLHRDVVQ